MPPKPLGYIALPDGNKAIYPMNDIFLNYLYEKPIYWESLRIMVNIVIEAYRIINPATALQLITDEIEVLTQYKYLLSRDLKTTREQDIKVIEIGRSITFLELQNRINIIPPIEIRSVGYFGLGIGHGKGKPVNQIWLLAESPDSVLHGEAIKRYVLKDEVTNSPHPYTAGILYVSLERIKNESTAFGELAGYLLGEVTDPINEDVKKITAAFNGGFNEFKEDKEVPPMLSFTERWFAEGKAEGEAKGKAEGEAKGKAEGEANGILATAINMVKELHVTVTKAMQVAKLPEHEKDRLIQALENEKVSYAL